MLPEQSCNPEYPCMPSQSLLLPSDGVLCLEEKQQQIVCANEGFCQLLACNLTELLKKHAWELFADPASQNRLHTALASLADTNQVRFYVAPVSRTRKNTAMGLPCLAAA